MNRRRLLMNPNGAIVVAVLLLFLSACSRGIDQAKFAAVYRAGQDMKSATEVGSTLARYRELLQAFASQVAQAKDAARNDREQAMVGQFDAALTAYRDAADAWTIKIDRPTIPDDSPLIAKYALPSEAPIASAPTYRVVSAEAALQTIWSKATAAINIANAIYTGKAQ